MAAFSQELIKPSQESTENARFKESVLKQMAALNQELAKLTQESSDNARFKNAVLEHLVSVTQDLTGLRIRLEKYKARSGRSGFDKRLAQGFDPGYSVQRHTGYPRHCSAAATKSRNSGWGRLGRDFSSG